MFTQDSQVVEATPLSTSTTYNRWKCVNNSPQSFTTLNPDEGYATAEEVPNCPSVCPLHFSQAILVVSPEQCVVDVSIKVLKREWQNPYWVYTIGYEEVA